MSASARREEVFAVGALATILAVTAGWWALALWPTGDAVPYWLARTRSVCFGVRGGGLPDAAGWASLVGQPLIMLAVLLVGWGRALRRGLRRVAAARTGRMAIVAVVAALAVGVGGATSAVRRAAGSGGADAGAPADAPVPEAYPRLDRTAPPLRLVDQHGDTTTLAGLRGRPVLLTFAYAHCSTVCPLLVRDVLDAQTALEDRRAARRPVVVVVTVDPWRDTPTRLPAIARKWGFGEDAYVLSGASAVVEATLDAWHVAAARDERTGEITHPRLVYVLDREGRIAYAANGARGALVELVGRL